MPAAAERLRHGILLSSRVALEGYLPSLSAAGIRLIQGAPDS
jgi:hypothetical protein